MIFFGEEGPVLLNEGFESREVDEVLPLVGIIEMIVELFASVIIADVAISLRADATVA